MSERRIQPEYYEPSAIRHRAMPAVLSAAAVVLVSIAGTGQAKADGGGDESVPVSTAPMSELPPSEEQPLPEAVESSSTTESKVADSSEELPEETPVAQDPERHQSQPEQEPEKTLNQDRTDDAPRPVMDRIPENEKQTDDHEDVARPQSTEMRTEESASEAPQPTKAPTRSAPPSTGESPKPSRESENTESSAPHTTERPVPAIESMPASESENETSSSHGTDELKDVAVEPEEPQQSEGRPDPEHIEPKMESIDIDESERKADDEEPVEQESNEETIKPQSTQLPDRPQESEEDDESVNPAEETNSPIIPVSKPWSKQSENIEDSEVNGNENTQEQNEPEPVEEPDKSANFNPVIVSVPSSTQHNSLQFQQDAEKETEPEPKTEPVDDTQDIRPVIDAIPGRHEVSENSGSLPLNEDDEVIIPASVPLPPSGDDPVPAPSESAAAPPPDVQPEVSPAHAFVLPVHGRITSGFGARWGSFNYGLDIAAPAGTEMYAMADGVVIEEEAASGFGWWIRILHDNGDVTVYGHMYPQDSRVHVNDRVSAGDVISLVGNNGPDTTGPHGHIEVWVGGLRENRVDPLTYMRERGVKI